MKKLLFISIALSIMTAIVAQEKYLSLEDLIPGGKTYTDFLPKASNDYEWNGDELVSLKKGDKRSNNNLPEAFPVESDYQNIDYCPANQSIAFTKANNLYIRSAQSEAFAVVEDTNPAIVYGQAVHRNEFGIMTGTFWSPNGNYLAFYRMDETMVEDYPLVDISSREAKLKSIKYPMAGMPSHEVTVGIYHLQSGKTIYLKTGEPKDKYLTSITWEPSERYIYIAELNREQNHMMLNKYDVSTGEKVATLFEERNERYVEPQHPLLFLQTKPEQFVWQSRRDGYNHLYLYETSGKLIRQLTSGDFEVTSVLGLNKDDKDILYVSNEGNPIEFQLFKTSLKNGKKTQLTKAAGVHRPVMNASGTKVLDMYSNQNTPLNIDLIDVKKGNISHLESTPNPYDDYLLPEITLGSIKSTDGTCDLYYRLVKPTDFDETKKYPTIVYVYGGPHSQMIVNSWMGSVRGWDIHMANLGYVVFTLDNRGTSNRGHEFESIIHRRLGKYEMEDQMAGIDFLFSLPYVDKDRVGVHGWSYGGFMTSNMILRQSDIFKVAVAGGPVIDWKYYEIMYGERYMDSPEENPEGYAETNINSLAGNLKGRFMLIHGDEDPVVVWQHSLSFLKACIQAGTYPDYFVYPGQEHNMRGRDRIHLHEKLTRYFEDYLKPLK